MTIRRHLAALAFAAALCPATSAFAGDPITSITNQEVGAMSSASYWTAERTREAKPMTLGRIHGTPIDPMSYGTAVLDFTRSRVSPRSNVRQRPYRAIGKLYFTIPGSGDFQCSASVIGKRMVVTAAHCIYSGSTFHTNWAFIPAFDGNEPTLATQRPYGTWNWNRAEIPINWINTAGALPNNTDFGVIIFSDQSFGGGPPVNLASQVGQLRTVNGHLADTHVTMLGYPCNFDACLLMQRTDSSDHRPGSTAPGNNAFEYGSDMTGGSSGGPWVENFGDPNAAAPQGSWTTRNVVVGVTSYGYIDPNVLILGASQFNDDFTLIRNNSCAAAPGNC